MLQMHCFNTLILSIFHLSTLDAEVGTLNAEVSTVYAEVSTRNAELEYSECSNGGTVYIKQVKI